LRRILGFICVVFIAVCFGVLQIFAVARADFSQWEWEEIVVVGTVLDKEIRSSEKGEVLLLKVLPIDTPTMSAGKIFCYAGDISNEPKMGSVIKIKGKLKGFEEARNPGQFDLAGFYQILKVDFRLYNAEILGVSAEYSKYREGLYQIKRALGRSLDEFFDSVNASVFRTMLLGESGQTDAEIKALFKRNGIVHILTISGLHISIIGMGFYKLLRRVWIPNFVAAPLAIFIMLSYGVMTSMGAASIRAIVMFSLRMTAGFFKRTYDLLTALSVAAVLLLLEQPLYLFHSGFLFSFLAVLAIGLIIPVMNYQETDVLPSGGAYRKKLCVHPGWRNLRAFFKRRKYKYFGKIIRKYPRLKSFSPFNKLKNAFLSGFIISSIHLPIYLNYYYEFPLYSILLNLIIIPLMSFLMISGIITMTVGMVFVPLGKITSVISNTILTFYEKACLFCDELPYNSLILGSSEDWQVSVFAGVILGLIFYHKKIKQFLRYVIYIAAIAVLLIRMPADLTITFLDVGQGDAIFIATPNRRYYLIDGGSSSINGVGEYRILPFLKSQGVSRLDGWFITHPDLDHYSAFPELAVKMKRGGVMIDNLILPDIVKESRNEEYKMIEKIAFSAGIKLRYMSRGQSIQDSEEKISITCLHPYSGSFWAESETNAYSLTLLLEYGEFSLLLTGDVEGAGEAELKRYLADAGAASDLTILKVAHHGSRNSTDERFLELTAPSFSVISAGKENSYGHPHRDLMRRLSESGSEIYITYESGAVTIKTDGRGLKINEFLSRDH